MNENRLPPGYVPLTIHELNGQTVKQGGSRRSDNDRPRRNGKNGGKPGRMHNKRRPRHDDDQQDETPVEE